MSMLENKGQASLLDVLLIGLFISILLVVNSYFGNAPYQAEVSREEVLYSDTALASMMNYVNKTYDSYDNKFNLTIAEMFDLYYCGKDNVRIYESQLNKTVMWFLDKIIPENYNYIFWTKDPESKRGIHVWRGQPDVCAEYIAVKSFNYKITCREERVPITLFIWPSWKEIPRKGEC